MMAQAEDSGPSYTVLRIKRKATEQPLSSLVISGDPVGRSKKRREIAGNDRTRGIFRLAETVPETWKGAGEEAVVLRERIRGLLGDSNASTPQEEVEAKDASLFPKDAADLPMGETGVNSNTGREDGSGPKRDEPALPSGRRLSLQYRVVAPPPLHARSILPPKVMTIAEEQAAKSPFNFVDAEAVAGPSRQSLTTLQEEKDMASFLPMLEEYLKRCKADFPVEQPQAGAKSRTAKSREGETYVYDLYYRDIRPGGTTPLGLGAGIGALLGYNDDSPPSTPSDSEPEDEADEDSNDEDYYRNDYPEDEDADEDMMGYRDVYDESEEDEEGDQEASDGEAGVWGYR